MKYSHSFSYFMLISIVILFWFLFFLVLHYFRFVDYNTGRQFLLAGNSVSVQMQISVTIQLESSGAYRKTF